MNFVFDVFIDNLFAFSHSVTLFISPCVVFANVCKHLSEGNALVSSAYKTKDSISLYFKCP